MPSVAKDILLAVSRDHSWQGRGTICDDGDRNRSGQLHTKPAHSPLYYLSWHEAKSLIPGIPQTNLTALFCASCNVQPCHSQGYQTFTIECDAREYNNQNARVGSAWPHEQVCKQAGNLMYTSASTMGCAGSTAMCDRCRGLQYQSYGGKRRTQPNFIPCKQTKYSHLLVFMDLE